MKLTTINTGFFKLDGGAMFGVVPKTIWNKLNPADENNMCNWAMRCLLIEDGNRLMLIDNGIGNKQDAKFFSHYYLNGEDSLEKSLNKAGYSSSDITDMILTHLHFDHCGGSIRWNEARTGFEPAFENATYWIHKDHWVEALSPNPREKASFLKDNILPIEQSGQLKLMDESTQIHSGLSFIKSMGHTHSMIIPHIFDGTRTFVFMADLMPSVAHIPPHYVMGYDVRPLETMSERNLFLKSAVEKKYILFFEHDPVNECCTVQLTEKGYKPDQIFRLSE